MTKANFKNHFRSHQAYQADMRAHTHTFFFSLPVKIHLYVLYAKILYLLNTFYCVVILWTPLGKGKILLIFFLKREFLVKCSQRLFKTFDKKANLKHVKVNITNYAGVGLSVCVGTGDFLNRMSCFVLDCRVCPIRDCAASMF